MKTVADLKRRLLPQEKITLVTTNMANNRWLGVKRTIVNIMSKGINISTEPGRASFLDFPKKAEFFPIDENTFEIRYLDSNLILRYKLGE